MTVRGERGREEKGKGVKEIEESDIRGYQHSVTLFLQTYIQLCLSALLTPVV